MQPFIYQNWHAWASNGRVMLSDESTKQLRDFADVDGAVNALYLEGHKEAARALNAHAKATKPAAEEAPRMPIIRSATARRLMYEWHGGQGSPFYAAASSGLVASFELLMSECREITDKAARLKLAAWIDAQQKRAPRVTVKGSQCHYYHALPWAAPVVVTFERTRREVPAPRNGKPGYAWRQGYIVNGEFPPVGRAEAFERAREIGGPRVQVVIK